MSAAGSTPDSDHHQEQTAWEDQKGTRGNSKEAGGKQKDLAPLDLLCPNSILAHAGELMKQIAETYRKEKGPLTPDELFKEKVYAAYGCDCQYCEDMYVDELIREPGY